MKRRLEDMGDISSEGSKTKQPTKQPSSTFKPSTKIGDHITNNDIAATASAMSNSRLRTYEMTSPSPTAHLAKTNKSGDSNTIDSDQDEMDMEDEFDKPAERGGGSGVEGVGKRRAKSAEGVGKRRTKSFKMCKVTKSFEVDGVNYTIAELRPFFTRPFTEAAKVLGLSVGRMSRACRTCQLHRWPYRKLWGISHNIKSLERIIEDTKHEHEDIFRNQIKFLAKRHQEIIDFPEKIYTPPENESSTQCVSSLETSSSSSSSSSSRFLFASKQNEMQMNSSFGANVGPATQIRQSRMMGSVQLLERIESVIEEIKTIEVEQALLQQRSREL
jgi:hypothetical protein